MVRLVGLSERAKIGKILILAALILGVIVVSMALCIVLFLLFLRHVSVLTLLILAGMIGIKIVGLVFGMLAYRSANQGDFNMAGMYALISCALPPLDVVMASGAVFCLVSTEATAKSGAG